MKRNLKSLTGFTMGATDGEVGKVVDFYFDDHSWTVRYIIVETGSLMHHRKVLISPESLLNVDWDNKVFPVNLTTEQIKTSPDINTERPVERQQEIELHKHYPWSNYWTGGLGPGSLWGGGIGTTGMMGGSVEIFDSPLRKEEDSPHTPEPGGDPQLRSYGKVKSYMINATDGAIGNVEDFVVDDGTWQIELLVVDTGNWLPGKKVLISPRWIKEIDWAMTTVIVNVSTDKVKHSPKYDPSKPIEDDHHTDLHNYYHNQA
jgi:uncharacterized protein YrrD